ncbi:pyridoxamine 5'-phosphate oxidase family protein [Chloroflexota bacterium]
MENTENVTGLIKRIFTSQRFAVLATHSDGQPYSNLVAFAETEELGSLLFVTSRDTRKYANARSNRKVALLVDSRTNQVADLQTAVAITALGTIGEVDKSDRANLSEIYKAKHPQLADFLHKPSNALMEVAVTGYVVASFQGTNYLSIDKTG